MIRKAMMVTAMTMAALLAAPLAQTEGFVNESSAVLGEKLDSGLGNMVYGESLDSGLGELSPNYTAAEFDNQPVLGEKQDSGLGEMVYGESLDDGLAQVTDEEIRRLVLASEKIALSN